MAPSQETTYMCLNHLDFPSWDRVVFTDECTIQLGPIMQWMWLRRGEEVFEEEDRNAQKVHIWGRWVFVVILQSCTSTSGSPA